jgi:hypothetical protein
VAAVHMVFRRRRIKGRLKEQKYIWAHTHNFVL